MKGRGLWRAYQVDEAHHRSDAEKRRRSEAQEARDSSSDASSHSIRDHHLIGRGLNPSSWSEQASNEQGLPFRNGESGSRHETRQYEENLASLENLKKLKRVMKGMKTQGIAQERISERRDSIEKYEQQNVISSTHQYQFPELPQREGKGLLSAEEAMRLKVIPIGENGEPAPRAFNLSSESTPDSPILLGGMKRFGSFFKGETSRGSADDLRQQADSHYALGNYGQAEQSYKSAIENYKRKPKPDQLKIAMAQSGLANVYCEQGKHREAEELYKSVLLIYEQHLEPNEYRTEGVRRKLADIAEKLEQFGNYHRGELLGQGGFANVYRGEHIHLPDQQVAIKKLHTCLVNPENVREFRREAEILAKLDHPHIMRVMDFGVKNGFTYLLMEYAPYGTLRSKHPQGTCLSPTQVAVYVNKIADALDYLHNLKDKDQKPLMHLDLKPENILLGADGEVLLSDFGLAQTIERTTAQLTQEKIAGTLAYMAPEQIEGKARPASDQYALGVMVYEWLSGKRPFQGKRQMEIMAQHLNADPPPFYGKIPGLSREIEQVVFKALEKDPKDRFPNVKAFAEAFKQACGDCSSSGEREEASSSRETLYG